MSKCEQRQTLQALTACFPIYGAVACGSWAGRFSEALSIEVSSYALGSIPQILTFHRQVFHATDPDTMELALTTFQSLFSTLYPDIDPTAVAKLQTVDEDEEMPIEATAEMQSGEIQGVAVKVVANSLDELREPDKSNAKPAARILAALITSSSTSIVRQRGTQLTRLSSRSPRPLHSHSRPSSTTFSLQESRRSLTPRQSGRAHV